MSSAADNFCKQFGTSSDPTERRAWSGSKLFDTDSIPEIFFFKKLILKKSADDIKSMENYPGGRNCHQKFAAQIFKSLLYETK